MGNNYIIGVIIIILIIALIVTLYKQGTCEPCKLENDRIKILENKLESSSKTEKNESNVEKYESIPVNNPLINLKGGDLEEKKKEAKKYETLKKLLEESLSE
jgi:hypothetical protein